VLAATTKLRVSSFFDVILKRSYDDDDTEDSDMGDDTDMDDTDVKKFIEEYQESLLEFMMPFGLRSQPPETE